MIQTISTWTALRNPVFMRLWVANVVSGTWVSAHNTAATWTMNTLSPSPFLISLMASMASLPFLLFTLPAGALADIVDRRKLLCLMHLWLATGAAGLAVLGWLHLLNPYLILACVFFIGIGFAFNSPAFASIVPQIVSDAELPSAVILGGLQLNISGIIGPTLGGLLVPWLGPNFVFAINGACFLVVILALLQWKRAAAQARPPLEGFVDSFVTAIRYVRHAPGLQVVLARNALFAFCISAVPALMPVAGLKVLHLSASSLGLLFTSMSAGSVVTAVVIFPRLRARYSPNTLITWANILVALVCALMAVVHQKSLFLLVAGFAGVGWTLSACELWVAAQRAMPDWARGRMNAAIVMVSQGALALGVVIWGAAAAAVGVGYALLAAAAFHLISLIFARPLSINFTRALSFDPATVAQVSPELTRPLRPDEGPISIATEFKITCAHRREFVSLMRDVRRILLRNGGQGWGLHEDFTRADAFRLEMTFPSWNERLLQLQRMTQADKALLEKAWGLHQGISPPEERVYVCRKNGFTSR
jgi:MFS family permease